MQIKESHVYPAGPAEAVVSKCLPGLRGQDVWVDAEDAPPQDGAEVALDALEALWRIFTDKYNFTFGV